MRCAQIRYCTDVRTYVLAGVPQSPSLEGLESWDTIQPDILPDFTPRFAKTKSEQALMMG